jgi:Zn-dependent peptidase ImmA (M78 family)/transcriptional regulator with XRE-family HTH domain
VKDEARSAAPIFDPARLKLARESRGLLKSRLAQLVHVTPAAIGQFESGAARPSAATLAQIGLALDYPPSFFAFSGESRTQRTISDTFFRSLRSARQAELLKAVAHATLVHELVGKVEERVSFPSLDLPTDLHVDASTSKQQIEEIAQTLRGRWALPPGPIPHVVRLLELHGLVVTRYRAESARLDAFSQPFGDRPIVVLGDDKGAADRSRLDAAHELGHLVMHPDPQPGDRTLENQANTFAAGFLMPRREIMESLPERRIDWMEMVSLKRTWGVSIAALLYRAHDLGRLEPATYEKAMKTMSRRGWRKQEPGSLGASEQPQLLAKAIEALATVGFSVADLAAEMHLSEATLREILGVGDAGAQRVPLRLAEDSG